MSRNSKEGSLRNYLREALKKRINWIEPTRGSSVGVPDTTIDVGAVSIPVELKFWEWRKKGLYHPMRPAQIRYHVMAHKAGKKTAILFATPDEHVGFHIYMLPNKYCPQDDYGLDTVRHNLFVIGTEKANKELVGREIVRLLKSSNWWSGGIA